MQGATFFVSFVFVRPLSFNEHLFLDFYILHSNTFHINFLYAIPFKTFLAFLQFVC